LHCSILSTNGTGGLRRQIVIGPRQYRIKEALLLADDRRLAPRTIRLRALLVELVEPAAGAESIAEAGGT
jgi:hypothetical protein